jgi:hypothetical protein
VTVGVLPSFAARHATVGALEQLGSQTVFEIPKSTAWRRLPDVQSLGGLPKATVPRCDKRPSKVSHIDVHPAPAKSLSLAKGIK